MSSRLDANSFVLKVVGKEEYFLKEVPIIQYKVGVSGASRCPVWAPSLVFSVVFIPLAAVCGFLYC